MGVAARLLHISSPFFANRWPYFVKRKSSKISPMGTKSSLSLSHRGMKWQYANKPAVIILCVTLSFLLSSCPWERQLLKEINFPDKYRSALHTPHTSCLLFVSLSWRIYLFYKSSNPNDTAGCLPIPSQTTQVIAPKLAHLSVFWSVFSVVKV